MLKKKVSLKFWLLCITHSSLSCKQVHVHQLNVCVENLNVSKTHTEPSSNYFSYRICSDLNKLILLDVILIVVVKLLFIRFPT